MQFYQRLEPLTNVNTNAVDTLPEGVL